MRKDADSGVGSMNVLLTAVIAGFAALVIGGAVLFGGDDDGPVPLNVLHAEHSPTLTESSDAEVTVTEFLDYQCAACEEFHTSVGDDLKAEYDGDITFVVRNFPLSAHELAEPAARAAEAAGMQGEYEAMHDALFDNYAVWAAEPDGSGPSEDEDRAQEQFDAFASDLGLDMDQFRQDMASDEVNERIERDLADADEADVSQTPTLFINEERFVPENGDDFDAVGEQFRAEIDAALADEPGA